MRVPFATDMPRAREGIFAELLGAPARNAGKCNVPCAAHFQHLRAVGATNRLRVQLLGWRLARLVARRLDPGLHGSGVVRPDDAEHGGAAAARGSFVYAAGARSPEGERVGPLGGGEPLELDEADRLDHLVGAERAPGGLRQDDAAALLVSQALQARGPVDR